MLVPSDIYSRYSWVSIDPGLTTCGFSIFTVVNRSIESIEAFTITNNKINLISDYQDQYHSDRQIRMHRLCLVWNEILYRVNPIAVICESPFYNPRMPGAFGSLTETVAALRITLNNFSTITPFISYSPQEVKQSFKRSGQVGKLVMREALLEVPELLSKLHTSIENLDEHAIDSIAVGYTWWLRLQS